LNLHCARIGELKEQSEGEVEEKGMVNAKVFGVSEVPRSTTTTIKAVIAERYNYDTDRESTTKE